jgi:ABC-type lipoprotein export system ATPase subunit/uncharacterized protein (UPF0335 family)
MSEAEREIALAQLVEKLANSDVAAFAVMDYWTFEGYLAIRDYLSQHSDTTWTKGLFPGMELRLESPTSFRLNVHVVLSDQVSRQSLTDFCASLKLRIRGDLRSLSREALIDLARSLGASKANHHGFGKDDLSVPDRLFELGCMTAEVTRDSFLEASRQLKDSALILLPYDTSDGLAGIDWRKHGQSANELLRMAHLYETRKPENADLFLGRRTAENERFIDEFLEAMGGYPKPAVCGSDSHRLEDYGHFPGDRPMWVKADPTWPGLVSTTCEPIERTHIGDRPSQLDRVASNRTRYVQSIAIRKRPASALAEAWFDNDLVLNHGLVAIIGNKGSGKSALTDIIGLLGNTRREKWFPFLNEQQFRQPGDNKAANFDATVTWESQQRETRCLGDRSDPNRLESICYIPQNCFDEICNELARPGLSAFDAELKSVIFSHVEPPDRLGKSTLDEVIEFRTGEIEQGMSRLRSKMSRLNQEIVLLEDQATPEHRAALEERLRQKQAELDALDAAKPSKVKKPRGKPREAAKAEQNIDTLKREREGLQAKIRTAQSDQEHLALIVSRLDQLLERVRRVEREFADLADEYGEDLKSVGLDLKELAKLSVNAKPIREKRAELQKARAERDAALDPESSTSLVGQVKPLDARLKKLRSQLDEPNRRYERFLEDQAAWNAKRQEVLGSKTVPGTLRYFADKLSELDAVPTKLAERRQDRLDLAESIHGEITRLAGIFSDLYGPVQHFIRDHPIARDKFRLVFDVSVVDVEFQHRLFDWIHQGVSGSFYGVDEGRELLRELVAKYKFTTWKETREFLTEIMSHLLMDVRGESVSIASQLRKDRSVQSLYDYIFSLEYLKPRYVLKMGDRHLHELSPGEKGTLLLVFYLLVDRSATPLVIDQPEANLDNETIFDLLVPAIKEAKQRRQIIVVTHNPNIAVVCDADQVICASLDKARGCKVEYATGAIENPGINRRIVEVLEGTMPAFENRDAKYTLIAGVRRRLFTS